MYIGVSGKARKVKKMYVGVSGKARKVKKAYVGVNGKARLFYEAIVEFSYTGTHENLGQYTINGKSCTLYRLTGSGTLKCSDPFSVWMCGGGGTGATAAYDDDYTNVISGGGGGGGYIASGSLSSGQYSAVVGAAGGASSIGGISANAGASVTGHNGGAGGSGGGRGINSSRIDGTVEARPGTWGSNQGVSTAPFGITSLYYHSGGGGGGGSWLSGNSHYGSGGCGCSNGTATTATASEYNVRAAGGEKGGGAGGISLRGYVTYPSVTTHKEHAIGNAATFFGSGGGGGGLYTYNSNVCAGEGGAGYQGCIYAAIPV